MVSVDFEGDEEDLEATGERIRLEGVPSRMMGVLIHLRMRKAMVKRTTSHPSTRALSPLGAERPIRLVVVSPAVTLPAAYDLDADADA